RGHAAGAARRAHAGGAGRDRRPVRIPPCAVVAAGTDPGGAPPRRAPAPGRHRAASRIAAARLDPGQRRGRPARTTAPWRAVGGQAGARRRPLRTRPAAGTRRAQELTVGIVFWLAACVVAFTYAGYPLLMAVRAALGARPVASDPQLPTIDVLLVAHGAAGQVAAKLRNLLALDYPPERLRVTLACDGCNDTEAAARAVDSPRPPIDVRLVARGAAGQVAARLRDLLGRDYPPERLRVTLACDGCNDTEAAARAVDSPRLRVLAFHPRRGKSACIADALPRLDA